MVSRNDTIFEEQLTPKKRTTNANENKNKDINSSISSSSEADTTGTNYDDLSIDDLKVPQGIFIIYYIDGGLFKPGADPALRFTRGGSLKRSKFMRRRQI